jgi:hypothetical protein
MFTSRLGRVPRQYAAVMPVQASNEKVDIPPFNVNGSGRFELEDSSALRLFPPSPTKDFRAIVQQLDDKHRVRHQPADSEHSGERPLISFYRMKYKVYRIHI